MPPARWQASPSAPAHLVDRAAEALNSALPPDVAVVEAAEGPPGFNARFSAVARSYRYVVLNRRERSALEARRALWWPRPVDDAALAAAAAALLGEHDFRSFTPTDTQHQLFRRDVRSAAWERGEDRLGVHDHGRFVPAPHGAHPRRDDAGTAALDPPPPRRATARGGRTDRAAVGLVFGAGRVLTSGSGATYVQSSPARQPPFLRRREKMSTMATVAAALTLDETAVAGLHAGFAPRPDHRAGRSDL